MKKTIAIVLALALSACATGPHKYERLDTPEAAQKRNAESQVKRQETVGFLRSADNQAILEALKTHLTDLTVIINQSGHGTYVEYTNPEGRLFMWYPGNGVVVRGNWGVQTVNGSPRACFNYKRAYHGVTGEYEPSECVRASQTLASTDHIAEYEGDVFNLSSGRIPYVKSFEGIPILPSEYKAVDEAAKVAKENKKAKQ